ncbi:flagellar export protein FliJ [Jeotgalibacillus soli]|uniref:Flagellar FliJ protein n=1 Tax=Jeotgalibacillus soli TaxID=889306 RepID=A0A0C2V7F2_9BACL|nr:flagellar export protein FliJ [Jeotgalibacillus soli]KIL44887.1 hypothetical protein KP78_24310 [Jeotgalibacillus soli]
MVYQFRFDRVLTVKEREQKEEEDRYRESIESFEAIAQKLYHLLKQKEMMEQNQADQIKTGIPVQSLRHGQHFLTNIEKSIAHQQKLVIEARTNMQWHEQKLMDRNIEVKKYEKIKEKDYKKHLIQVNDLDHRRMDELSMMQYMKSRK